MTFRGRHTRTFLPLALAGAVGVAVTLQAQEAPVPPTRPATTSGAKANSPTPAPPPLPQLASPVDQFRALLALTPAARESHLTNRPPAIRNRILAKLQEYDAMKPADRELRLRSTQLRWYLLSFMEMPAADRTSQLAVVPETDRAFVKDHLAQWDRLPADEQKEILKYEKLIENMVANGITNVVTIPVSNHLAVSNNLDSFLRLSSEQRQQMYDSFQKFFELSDAEKQKTMGALSPIERLQMNVALQKFSQLSPARREQCLNSFNIFSGMSDTERQEFLKNAERWREMSPAERQAWRDLVNSLPRRFPLPPGIAIPPPLPPPPLPTTSASRAPLQVNVPGPTNASQ